MALGSPKVSIFGAAFPAKVSTIAIAIGGLASFFVFGLLLRLSYPIGSSVSGVFYGNATPELVQVPLSLSNHTVEGLYTGSDVSVSDQNLTSHSSSGSGPDAVVSENIPPPGLDSDKKPLVDGKEEADEKKIDVGSGGGETNVPKAGDTPSVVSSSPHDDSKTASAEPGSGPDAVVSENIPPPGLDSDKKPLVDGKEETDEKKIDVGSGEGETNVPKAGDTPSVVSSSPHDDSKTASSEPECDLYQGSWFYDPEGPVYTNNSCPVITQMQNCQGNGRSDKGYENWRWKPSQCDLPRFDAKKFLELMRGKTLAFIGDSVARNQMESMLCLLWQVETPVNRGSRKMQRWLFKSSSVMIARIWSSWLVHQFNEKFDYAPEGVTKLKLDLPDERIIEALPKFDVVVLSSGHWFAKQSVYILNDEIVGGQLWWPDKSKPMKVNNVEAFGISVETILKSVATHPNYTGLTIVRTWSPDHYEGGAWNTGGSCTGKEEPILPGKLVKNGFTEIMHEKQATGFNRAVEGVSESSKVKLKLMDITEAFGYRHDGHPGPYRSPDPNKITKRGPDGRPPPQDCLHWCMPGPVDTWNEMVLELIRRDVEGGKRNS